MQMIVSGLPTFVPALRNWKQPLACLSSCVAVAGVAILYITPPLAEYGHRRLAGCIMISFSGVNYTVIMSVISSNVGGFTKKQVVTSTAFFLYCVINIITPQTFQGSEAPYYHTGLGFVLAYVALLSQPSNTNTNHNVQQLPFTLRRDKHVNLAPHGHRKQTPRQESAH